MSKSVTMTFDCLTRGEKTALLVYLVDWDDWAQGARGSYGRNSARYSVWQGLCYRSPVGLSPVFREQGRDPWYPFNRGSGELYRKFDDCRKSRPRRQWVRDAIAALKLELGAN